MKIQIIQRKNAELFLQMSELPTDMLKSFTESLNYELNLVNLQEPVFVSIWKNINQMLKDARLHKITPLKSK